MKMKDRARVFSGFVYRLVAGRLRHELVEIDAKEIFGLYQSRTLAWHEKHLLAALHPRAQVGEGVAQSFMGNDSERGNEVSLQTCEFDLGRHGEPFLRLVSKLRSANF